MNMVVWLSFLLILCSFKECQQCGIEICFSWKVSLNSLTLICKVNVLQHFIFIENQFNNRVADCVPDLCESYHQNATIIQIFESNKTIYTVNGQIDKKVNGNWTCRHGTNKDIAQVEVTVLKGKTTKLDDQVIDIDDKKEHRNNSKKVSRNCTESLICFTLVGFVTMLAVCAASNWILERYCNGMPACCRNKLFSFVLEVLTGFEALPKIALIGIFLLFLFGIPMCVSVVQDGTCHIVAIPAMVFMGLTLGGTISIVLFERKINDQNGENIPASTLEQVVVTDDEIENNSCDNSNQEYEAAVEVDPLFD